MNKIPFSIKLFLLFCCLNGLLGVALVCFSAPDPANNDDLQKGNNLFKTNCSGCHLHGENLIKSNKPVIGSSKLASKKLFKAFLESPPAPMPNFKNIVNKPNQLDALYKYVISLMAK